MSLFITIILSRSVPFHRYGLLPRPRPYLLLSGKRLQFIPLLHEKPIDQVVDRKEGRSDKKHQGADKHASSHDVDPEGAHVPILHVVDDEGKRGGDDDQEDQEQGEVDGLAPDLGADLF